MMRSRVTRVWLVAVLALAVVVGLAPTTRAEQIVGDARLVEDTTGQGHTTAVHGNRPCVTATIPLA